MVDGERNENYAAILKASQLGIDCRGKRFGRRAIPLWLGPIQMDHLDVGEIVFSEDAHYAFFVAHGDVP